MRHIKTENDWFYEWRPYFCLGAGAVGTANQYLLGAGHNFALLNFVSSTIVIGLGLLIIQMRKEYRRNTFMN